MATLRFWIQEEIGRPHKCIFFGEFGIVPRVGEHVEVADGYASESVLRISHCLYDGSADIFLSGFDTENDYGDCLIEKNAQKEET